MYNNNFIIILLFLIGAKYRSYLTTINVRIFIMNTLNNTITLL